jgi:hypothetical protein
MSGSGWRVYQCVVVHPHKIVISSSLVVGTENTASNVRRELWYRYAGIRMHWSILYVSTAARKPGEVFVLLEKTGACAHRQRYIRIRARHNNIMPHFCGKKWCRVASLFCHERDRTVPKVQFSVRPHHCSCVRCVWCG